MAVRIYLHFDGPPQYSKLFKLPVDSFVRPWDLLHSFIEAYSRKYPGTSVPQLEELAIKPIVGRELQAETVLRATESLESDYTILRKPSITS